jgi:hypothetical protein
VQRFLRDAAAFARRHLGVARGRAIPRDDLEVGSDAAGLREIEELVEKPRVHVVRLAAAVIERHVIQLLERGSIKIVAALEHDGDRFVRVRVEQRDRPLFLR